MNTFINKFLSLFTSPESQADRKQEFIDNKAEVFDSIRDPRENPSSIVDRLVWDQAAQDAHDVSSSDAYTRYINGSLPFEKPGRLDFYRSMATFPEVSDAMDEICDACISKDPQGNIIKLIVKDPGLNDAQEEELKIEFEKFIAMFNLENDGWRLFRDLIRDGEVTWENIVDNKDKKKGFIAINRIPPDCYEYMMDVKYNIVGVLLNAVMLRKAPRGLEFYNNDRLRGDINSQFTGRSAADFVLHDYIASAEKIIPIPVEAMTIVNTGEFNAKKTIVYPILEKARKAYKQLSLIEDAVIIYRLVRAPERLVFNVDTGVMPGPRAEALVKKMMNKFQSRRVYDPMTGGTTNDYEPISLQDNFWFAKPAGSTGTTVTRLAGGDNLGNIPDLKYFLRKLYTSLKIPSKKLDEMETQAMSRFNDITADEYRFCQFVIRIQREFAKGLHEAFVNHLKLKEFWKKYGLNRRSFLVEFITPSIYEIYQKNKQIMSNLEAFDKMKASDFFSKELAAKETLGWSDVDIENNYQRILQEKTRMAIIERQAKKIAETGLPFDMNLDKPESNEEL